MRTSSAKMMYRISVFFLLLTAATSVHAVNVGYYEMCDGQGDPNQTAAITAAGHTPVNIVDLSPVELASVELLLVNNCSNSNYSAEYMAALVDITAAVTTGLKLMIHDRYVTPAETILPGGGGFNIIRQLEADIDVLNDTTVLTNGPGGVIDNSTLDGGNSSLHGYAILGSLPGNGLFLLSTNDPAEIVSFAYGFGRGAVYYSSIPLDFYLGGSGNNPPADEFRDIYAVNAVAFGAGRGSGYMAALAAPLVEIPVPTMNNWGLLLMLSLMLMIGVGALRKYS